MNVVTGSEFVETSLEKAVTLLLYPFCFFVVCDGGEGESVFLLIFGGGWMFGSAPKRSPFWNKLRSFS